MPDSIVPMPTSTPDSAAAAPRASRPATGDRLTLDIVDLAFGGEGVGRAGDFVIFVPFTCPGDRVDVKITEVKSSFGRAQLVRVLKPGAERAEPRCEYFTECGGCQYQHIDYAAQLRWKHRQITELFRRLGGFEATAITPVVPCPQPYEYRNRILVRSQWNKPAQKLNLGFVRADCGLVCDIESCAIAEPALNEAITEWRRNPPPKGGLKTVLRIPPEGWEVPEHSFFQNNFFLLPGLLDGVRGRLRDAGVKHLFDIYCGVGFFALSLADAVTSFTGVELDAPAIRAARKNQASRGLTNGDFIAGDADLVLPSLLSKLDASQSSVLLDPPRVGCRPPSLEVLRQAGPAQILYVSCHPATLARDLKALCAGGRYRLAQVQPFDMFPQTQHVECVADLRLAGPL